MRPTNPTQIPDLREELIEKWGTRAWISASVRAHNPPHIYDGQDAPYHPFGQMSPEEQAVNACRTEARLLRSSSLWWVGEEMCDLLYSTLPSIPNDVRHSDLVFPSSHGLVMLAKPFAEGIDANHRDRKIIIDCFAWGHTQLFALPNVPQLAAGPTHAISMSSYRFLDFDAGMAGNELGLGAEYGALFEGIMGEGKQKGRNYHAMLHGGAWVPLGRSDWPDNLLLGDPLPVNPRAGTAAAHGEDLQAFQASTIQDRRIMAALFALLESPGITHREEYQPSRQVKRQAERRGKPAPSPVHIVYLRRPRTKAGHEGDGTGRVYSHRFIVRAHPVNQPYGPGRKYRKLIMRGPFVKGPGDAPLVPKETVNAWIR